ncbi:class I SAM-dependent methyltransferase [Geodermatophilus sp. DF01-2]|uniref:class I SAM-dependent methyltransferase n=1 Tax=Geodermatophilus sp. DF01-2 TaxID=2559610 RepID=UPI001073A68E|nr:class I SAM-dependent methyltransferase [Geodermatophilus sp. DF01_2]TFV62431.1 class I SAM-dependent methyltransferase [Geodermatophilus sp. DF01_2]
MTTPADWDARAQIFGAEPGHGLTDPSVRAAWRELLTPLLPSPPARVLALGCGTGSLAVLLAGSGHDVHGVDFAPAMVERARGKAAAAGVAARFRVGDASAPAVPPGSVDVVLCRHVLWTLPDPAAAVERWVGLLAPGGRMVLVEGRWATGGGLHAADVVDLVRTCREEAQAVHLTDPALWGRTVEDERFLVLSRR